jgi:hypothetical protein
MTDRRGFAEWEGQPVKVSYPGGSSPPAEYGILEEAMNWGVVLNHSITIEVRVKSRADDWTEYSSEVGRQVSEFLPWHRINKIRLLEPEEREQRGL